MELGVALALVNLVVLCLLLCLILVYITTIAEYRRLIKQFDHAAIKYSYPRK